MTAGSPQGKGKPSASAYTPPLVSVLIPAFNHARFVKETLESIRADSYPRKEVVLLDDGSTDGTFAVAHAWFEKNSSCFERVQASMQQHQGVCRTLNRLVLQARGEYVTLLASDDALVEGGIARRVRALEEHREWLAVFGDAELMGPDGEHLGASAMETLYRSNKLMLASSRSMTQELLLHWAVPGPVLLLRRATYELANIGTYSEDLAVEDLDFYLRLLATRKLGFVDQRVARYRIHATNQSRVSDQKHKLARDHLTACIRNLSRFNGFERFCLLLTATALSEHVGSLEEQGARKAVYRLAYLTLRVAMEVILAACRAYNALKISSGPLRVEDEP